MGGASAWGSVGSLHACVPLRAFMFDYVCLLLPFALPLGRSSAIWLALPRPVAKQRLVFAGQAAGGRPHLAGYNIQVFLPPYPRCYPPLVRAGGGARNQQLALKGSAGTLHSKACNALEPPDGVIQS